MSIASEIERLQTAKDDLKTSIENKGVTVPEGATLDDYPALVDSISGGGGMNVDVYYSSEEHDSLLIGKRLYLKIIESLADSGATINLLSGTDTDSLRYAFGNNSYISKVPKITGIENVTNMMGMFSNCSAVSDSKDLNLSEYNTSSITDFSSMFFLSSTYTPKMTSLDLSNFDLSSGTSYSNMFSGQKKIAVLDISGTDLNKNATWTTMFKEMGTACLQSDGAYADGIPYVYVKDATAQNLILTKSNGKPSTWSTNNVVIKSQMNQG